MFETNDDRLTWTQLPINQECDRFFLTGSTMYVSSNTVYKYSPEQHAGLPVVKQTKFVHTLSPVSPNPAIGQVKIEFDINEHRTNTVLEVISIDGRKIYPVMSGYLIPGHYSYVWDGSLATPGHYIIWLGTDEIPMVQKFVLNK